MYNTMEHLSDEVIMFMLGHVPPLDLLQSVSRVSKRFAELIRQDLFWENNPVSLPLLRCVRANKRSIQLYCAATTYQQQQQQQLSLSHAEASDNNLCSSSSAATATTPATTPDETNTTTTSEDAPSPPPFLIPQSLFVSRGDAMSGDNNKKWCVASSTDHDQERLENVFLDPNEDIYDRRRAAAVRHFLRLFGQHRWWSSMPSIDTESKETLVFQLKQSMAILSEIRIKPLREPFFEHGTVYTWKRMVVRAYLVVLDDDDKDGMSMIDDDESKLDSASSTTDRRAKEQQQQQQQQQQHNNDDSTTARSNDSNAILDAVLMGHNDNHHTNIRRQIPVYTSIEYVLSNPNSDDVLTITLPPGIVANVIQLDLLGKNYEQSPGMGYYVCVERVDCRGIPL